VWASCGEAEVDSKIFRLISHWCAEMEFRECVDRMEGFTPLPVDDFVAVKAPRFNKVQQISTSGVQHIPQQSLGNNRILRVSISG